MSNDVKRSYTMNAGLGDRSLVFSQKYYKHGIKLIWKCREAETLWSCGSIFKSALNVVR